MVSLFSPRFVLAALLCGTVWLVSWPTLSAQSVSAETTPVVDLKNLQADHPRLLWSKQDQEEALKAHARDPLWQSLQTTLRALADRVLTRPVAERKLIGIRLLGQSRAALERIFLTSHAWRMTGDARYRERALAEMRAVCAFPDWNPKHFLDTAEMAFAVALGYDWLYDTLSPADKKFFRESLVKLALEPALKTYRAKSGWHTRTNNWNQVCNGGIVTAALAIAEDEPELAREIIAAAVRSLPRAMDKYGPDGGYQEGPVYWNYGTTYNLIMIEALRKALGTDFGLGRHEAYQKSVVYFYQTRGNSGLYFNYADGMPYINTPPTYARMAATSPFSHDVLREDARLGLEKIIQKRSEQAERDEGRFFPLFSVWFPQKTGDSSQSAYTPPSHFRGNADIAMLKAPDAYVGFKAGKNNTPHAHLDLGSFVYDAFGVRWAVDLGGDNYDLPNYWDSNGGRWKIFRLNNHSHNTLTPENDLQKFKGVGVIEKVEVSPTRSFAIANLDDAYPNHFKSWKRGLNLDHARGVLVVQDEVVCLKKDTALEWKLFTCAQVTVDKDNPKTALLEQDGKAVHLFLSSPGDFVFKVKSADPQLRGQNKNSGVQQLVAEGTLPGESGVITVLLVPRLEKSAEEMGMYLLPAEPLATWNGK